MTENSATSQVMSMSLGDRFIRILNDDVSTGIICAERY